MRPVPTRANRRVVLAVLALVLSAGPLLVLARPARAAQAFVVTSIGDNADANPGDGRCDVRPNPGVQCTLRAAIQEANATPAADTIAFAIAGPGLKRIRPRTALPILTPRLTIAGHPQPGSRPNTAAVGTNAALRIELDGIDAEGDSVGIWLAGENSLVRGLSIVRFSSIGIFAAADGGRVLGCFVGTGAAGNRDLGNGAGILVGGSHAAIGNSTPAARNLISGNVQYGLSLGAETNGARVVGNLIGTDRTGNAPIGNSFHGVSSVATGSLIGGTTAAEANVIKFNGGNGVTVRDVFGINNAILRNEIGVNGGLGIDLNNDGRSPNNAGDAPFGANNTQNFPVITAAASTQVQLTLDSTPNEPFTIRLFSNPGAGDEGNAFHGTFRVVTDGTGTTGPETLVPNPPIPAGRSVTATATDNTGNTSEFSDPVAVA